LGALSGAGIAAGLGGILATLGWWLERRPDIAAVVRRIDRRAGWSGELVTAFEVGRRNSARPPATEVERTLAGRVAARLSLKRCLRAAAPSSVALLALPFASAAVLLLALDAAGERAGSDGSSAATAVPGRAGSGAASGSLASAARSLRSAAARSAAAAEAETARELLALADAADELRRELGSSAHDASAADALSEQAARLRDLAARTRLDPASTAEIEQAERALAAARIEWSRDRADARGANRVSGAGVPPHPAPDSDSAAASGSGARSAAADRGSASASVPGGRSTDVGGEQDRPARAAAGAGGTQDQDRTSPSPRTAAGPGLETEERGADSGRWWAQRYDAVVERWVETLRADRNGRPRSR
jgi:hypothetical protein